MVGHLFCDLLDRLLRRSVWTSKARFDHKQKDRTHVCADLRRSRFALDVRHSSTLAADADDDWSRDRLGVDPLDALRDSVERVAGGANGRLHGRLQFLYRAA